MSFTKYSTLGAALTYAREHENLSRSLSDGIYSGCQAYPDSASVNFRVSVQGGYFSKSGILWYDDEDHTEILDLGSVVDADGDHHIIWYNIASGTPVISKKTGTFGTPATLTAVELATGVKIADIWLTNGATDIQDAVIQNQDVVLSNAELSKRAALRHVLTMDGYRLTVSGSTWTVEFKNMQVHTLNPSKQLGTSYVTQLPVNRTDVNATIDAAGTFGAQNRKVTITGMSDDAWALFFIRVDDIEDDYSSADIQYITYDEEISFRVNDAMRALLSGESVDPLTELYPNRPELHNIIPLFTVNGFASFIPGIGSIAEDATFENGAVNTYVNSLSSTVYGTGPITRSAGGDVDIDDVITNIDVLEVATLDHAYDGFEDGSADGAGRIITSDAGPVQINKEGIDPSGADDIFYSSLRIALDSDGSGNGDDHEAGIDIVSPEHSTDRRGLLHRHHARVSGASCVDTSVTWSSGGSGTLVATTLGSITALKMINAVGDENDVEAIAAAEELANTYYVEFNGGSSDPHQKRVWRLEFAGVIGGSGVFSMSDVDTGSSNISASFPTLPFSENVTIWEVVAATSEFTNIKRLKALSIHPLLASYPIGLQNPVISTNMSTARDFLVRSSSGNSWSSYIEATDTPPGTYTDFATGVVAGSLQSSGYYLFSLVNQGGGAVLKLSCFEEAGDAPLVIDSSASAANSTTGVVAGWGPAHVWIAYRQQSDDHVIVDCFDPRTGTSYFTGEDLGDREVRSIVAINEKCYVGLGADGSSSELIELDDTGATGTSYNAPYTVWGLDAAGGRLYASINDDGNITPGSKQYFVQFGFDLALTDPRLITDADLVKNGTLEGFTEWNGHKLAANEEFFCFTTFDGDYLYVTSYSHPIPTNNDAVSNVGVHLSTYKVPNSGDMDHVDLFFDIQGRLYLMYQPSSGDGVLLCFPDPSVLRTGWYRQFDGSTFDLRSACTDGVYLYLSASSTSKIYQVSLGDSSGFYKRTKSDKYKIPMRKA